MDREKVKAELDEIVEQCRGMDYIGFSTITEHCQNILAMLKEQEAEISKISNAYLYLVGKASKQPEIVRCKDCKHWDADDHECNIKTGWFACGADWYCADGERRTDDA